MPTPSDDTCDLTYLRTLYIGGSSSGSGPAWPAAVEHQK